MIICLKKMKSFIAAPNHDLFLKYDIWDGAKGSSRLLC